MDLRLIFLALAGAVVGSFLNVCIDRLPDGGSLLAPPSHCPACRRRLKPLELLPVLSYLALRGRCRSCRAPIPLRVPLVEAAGAILFTLTYLRFGWTWYTGLALLYGCLLLVMIGTDLERQRILNIVSYPSLALALLAAPLTPSRQLADLLLGGALAFVIFFILAVLSRRGMGMGDVKLAAFTGLIVGWPHVIPVLLLGFIAGGLAAGVLLILGRIRRKDRMAFGPYLGLAALVGLLYGDLLVAVWLPGASYGAF
jgi:leader peptidase (prepilin peptidase) / N-methyltransferase